VPIILELSDKIADSRDRPFTPSSSQRRPVSRHGVPESVPDPSLTPSPRTSPEKSSARDGFRPKRATGPRATSESNRLSRRGASSGLAARRTAFARGLGDRGRIPWPLRGPAIESIGRTASLRRRRTRGGVGTGLRAAPSRRASGGPARTASRPRPRGAHPAVRDNPIETLRSPALGRGAVPAPPLQLPRVVDERSRPGSRAGSKKTPQNPTKIIKIIQKNIKFTRS